MKVISGFLKGKNITGFNIDGTRPTMDRVKESVFASIQDYLKGSVVLDLFAGSGNLGIECLSNYAKFVYFNDKNIESVKVIKKNLSNFNISNAKVLNLDYVKCLNTIDTKFDLIFLDPPYKMEVISSILDIIIKKDLLTKNGLVICETESNITYNNYDLYKFKKYGSKKVYILRRIYEEK